MCEPTTPIDELVRLKHSIYALAEPAERGSFAEENRINAADGVIARLDWAIRQLKAAGEGEKNMGA